MTIQEMCNEKRIALGLTHQNIADQAEMPLQTVRNFFSRASKAPSIYTTAKICAVLGVSLDQFFGIAERLTQEEKHVADLQAHIEDQELTIQDLRRRARTMRHAILALGGVVIALLTWCIYFDLHCLDMGFFRGGFNGVYKM